MATKIYSINGMRIEAERENSAEYTITINGQVLVWISADTLDEFKIEITELLDKHRI